MKENKEEISNIKHNIKTVILIIIVISIIAIVTIFMISDDNEYDNNYEINSEIKKSPYWISSNSLETFDLYFLQLENEQVNKIYSPFLLNML